jgi:hypothetical protein
MSFTGADPGFQDGGHLKHNIVAMINEITKPRIIW